jgi:hypothetical protein
MLTPVDDDENDEANNDVVTGIIYLFGTLTCMLFDSRVTHSFISALYTKICHISTRPLGQELSVQTPRGERINELLSSLRDENKHSHVELK